VESAGEGGVKKVSIFSRGLPPKTHPPVLRSRLFFCELQISTFFFELTYNVTEKPPCDLQAYQQNAAGDKIL
jgi:hypothetical protein